MHRKGEQLQTAIQNLKLLSGYKQAQSGSFSHLMQKMMWQSFEKLRVHWKLRDRNQLHLDGVLKKNI